AGEERFGRQWWSLDLPYKTKERKVRAFYAAGDGGQLLLVVPELELAVVFLGGLYGAETGQLPLRVFVPGYILPAVN
ncbi:MAG TPA: 6-aminohexanoate hydrolase, partial [Vicinamibacteria bacterium]|nr:6-aminohexanoate hydrolase [Vicinamibacteria bacterium]